tara:strand:- start:2309 stop:2488 length:180 start_codon:yes stop_codon:yes gene_type:complete
LAELSGEDIKLAVGKAVVEARERSGYGDRLIPFTAAEISFIEDIVACTLENLLVSRESK